ncbi:MAG: hypothetical protein IJU16_08165 [Clostridia bacterium]|nr:hypothetical protein [Clostridia bacterium]
MLKKSFCLLFVALFLLAALPLSVAADGGKLNTVAVTLQKSGDGIEPLPNGKEMSAYIAEQKAAFDERIAQLTAGKDEAVVPDYSNLFSGNMYAVITQVTFAGTTYQNSDDLIAIGDPDDWENLYVISGTARKVTNYTVKYAWITVSGPASATCTVTFDPGTGTGEMDADTATVGREYELPACAFTKFHASFYKWKVDDTLYDPGDTVTPQGDTTVKAVWMLRYLMLDNSTDTSTTTVDADLVLTDTRTGKTAPIQIQHNETAASFSQPSDPTVNAWIEDAKTALQDALATYHATASGDSKIDLRMDSFGDDRVYTSTPCDLAFDDNGDAYVSVTESTGEYFHRWHYTVSLAATFTSLVGDLDLNGTVNMADAFLLYRGVSGQLTLSELQAAIGDMDGENGNNMADAFALYRTVSGQ